MANDGGAQRESHALGRKRDVRVAAQAVAVAMIVVVSMVVAMAVAVVKVAGGFLGFFVH